jgi:hypothetical protein
MHIVKYRQCKVLNIKISPRWKFYAKWAKFGQNWLKQTPFLNWLAGASPREKICYLACYIRFEILGVA